MLGCIDVFYGRSKAEEHEVDYLFIATSMLDIAFIAFIMYHLARTLNFLRARLHRAKLHIMLLTRNVLLGYGAACAAWGCWIMVVGHVDAFVEWAWTVFWLNSVMWDVLFCVALGALLVVWRPSGSSKELEYAQMDDDATEMGENAFAPGDDGGLTPEEGLELCTTAHPKSTVLASGRPAVKNEDNVFVPTITKFADYEFSSDDDKK